MTVAPYKIVLSSAGMSPVIAHVPHASTKIPQRVREFIVVGDAALYAEVVRLTDWHADHLFSWVLEVGATMFVNELSRVVFDPERFIDDASEPMAAAGQGAVYTRTTDGAPLAAIDETERANRITSLYEPYHEGFESTVAHVLQQFDMAVILDCHSFPSSPLPSDLDQSPRRPDICIGTDAFHTPASLVRELMDRFSVEGLRVGVNAPYAGTMVPLRYLQRDRRVSSVMIEVRRGLYCDEANGERNADFDTVRSTIERVVGPAVAALLKERPC